ncbi:hypothetical protein ABEB36_001302 [Hypothenemus hampei]|uniref:Uncharacterized protein n=1 Tax=Hypothenemus hampei TaxID=57062 RepID=A0ABD1FE73_HYPHA
MSKTSKSINHSAWEDHPNEKKFMDALTNFMTHSWAMVCQIRERNGLSPSYEMSSDEIARRIQDVSKKLEEKYKEVEALENQKAKLINKSPISNGSISVFPSKQGDGTISSSARSRNRKTGNATGSPCPPSCQEYSNNF